MGNVIRNMEILKKESKVEVKNAVTEMKNALDGPTRDWTWMREESVSLEIDQ